MNRIYRCYSIFCWVQGPKLNISWHGMGDTQSGVEKDGLRSLVLHSWMLALWIRINIHCTWPIFANPGFLWNIFPLVPFAIFLLWNGSHVLDSVTIILSGSEFMHIYIYHQISTHLIHFGPPISVSWIVGCMCFSLIKMFIWPFHTWYFKTQPLSIMPSLLPSSLFPTHRLLH